MIEFLLQVFESGLTKPSSGKTRYFSRWLEEQIAKWRSIMLLHNVSPGAVVAIRRISLRTGGIFLALIEHRCVLVPLTSSVEMKKPEFMGIAKVETSFQLDEQDNLTVVHRDCAASHSYYQRLRQSTLPA